MDVFMEHISINDTLLLSASYCFLSTLLSILYTLQLCYTIYTLGFPGGSVVKNLPALQEMRVWPLGPKVLLEKEMSTHSSFLAWEIPWTEEPGGLQSMGSKRVRYDLLTKQQQHTYIIHHKYVSLPRKPWLQISNH